MAGIILFSNFIIFSIRLPPPERKDLAMRIAILLLSTILLSGCARETPVSDTIADNAVNATTALEQQLPAECKTTAVTTQFDVIRTEIRAVKTACQTEKDVITSEKLKWQWAFWALAAMVAVYFARKILK